MGDVYRFISRRPVATYFALTYLISWGGLLLVGAPRGAAGSAWQSDPALPWLFVAMLAGPLVAGLAMTGLLSGPAGLRELGARLCRWRGGARWYAVALLTAPAVFVTVNAALALASPAFGLRMPDTDAPASFLLAAIGGALAVGLLEEIGWTGFAVPRLRRRYGIVATGLAVGVPWGAWHLLTNDLWIVNAYAGDLPPAVFLIANGLLLATGQLPAYRVLMVWVYDRTGSLLLSVLMHASLSASTFVVAMSATGLTFLAHGLVMAVTWWIVVAIVAAAHRERAARATFDIRTSLRALRLPGRT